MRPGDPATLADTQQANLILFLLVYMDWPSGPVRLSSTPFTVPWDGHDWLGVGDLGKITAIEEGSEIKSYGAAFAMSGIRRDYLREVTTAPLQGRPCKLWFGTMTPDHDRLRFRPPLLIFAGRMDIATVELGETCTITVSAESRLVDWERPRVRRYTHEDQQAAFPDDMGLEFVAGMAEKELIWGRG